MTARAPQLRFTLRVIGAVLAMAVSTVALVGCVPAFESGPKPADDAPPVVSPEDSIIPTQKPAKPSDCVVVPAGVLDAVDQILVNPGDSLPFAAGWYDEEAKLWIIVGALAGPSGEGEGIAGAWGSKSDIASAPFDGELWALDSNASNFSTAPLSDIYVFERQPRLGAVYKCYPALKFEAGK
jgi:hypothetical protein